MKWHGGSHTGESGDCGRLSRGMTDWRTHIHRRPRAQALTHTDTNKNTHTHDAHSWTDINIDTRAHTHARKEWHSYWHSKARIVTSCAHGHTHTHTCTHFHTHWHTLTGTQPRVCGAMEGDEVCSLEASKSWALCHVTCHVRSVLVYHGQQVLWCYGQTDRHNETNKWFLQFLRARLTTHLHFRVKCLLILSDFNQNLIISTYFTTAHQHKMSRKSIRWEPSCFICTDGRADRQTDTCRC
jgi:hypothetical protein